ncbi:ABC transporter substrate-binding protein [Paenibacillus paeoniae]|uniref:Carbohydrate ABC transporter substrate-binding protein n=1 Tax=Paenibacillus paeoniae TaxID=2292705 RepID=A0A371P701_9BACL|nr:ABC transporter substrate-binding protein [Paenibacillus paeoniae]REK71723.1 carbohydrate ABC transporter substrate-binding protein [Paenibacillus paeoniae]
MYSIKSITIMLVSSIMIGLLSGCTKTEPPPQEAILKLMVDNLYSFPYEPLIIGQFPHITLEIIDVSQARTFRSGDTPEIVEKRVRDLINSENPDIFYNLNPAQYGTRLVNLEPLISRDKFELSEVHNYHINNLKANEMPITQLSPTFDRYALYLNHNVFKQASVDIPQTSVNWEQLHHTAQLFAGQEYNDKPVYGYYIGNYWYQIWSDVGAMNSMRLFDRGGNITNDLEPWRKLLEQLAQDALSGAMLTSQEVNYETMKQTAMFIGNSMPLSWLASNNESPDDWSIISYPMDTRNPQPYPYYMTGNLYINQASPYEDQAWEVIKYINSPAAAKLISASSSGLSVYKEYIPLKPFAIDAFLDNPGSPRLYGTNPDSDKLSEFAGDLQSGMAAVVAEQQTFEELWSLLEHKSKELFLSE